MQNMYFGSIQRHLKSPLEIPLSSFAQHSVLHTRLCNRILDFITGFEGNLLCFLWTNLQSCFYFSGFACTQIYMIIRMLSSDIIEVLFPEKCNESFLYWQDIGICEGRITRQEVFCACLSVCGFLNFLFASVIIRLALYPKVINGVPHSVHVWFAIK